MKFSIRDPLWQFVAVILGIMAIIITILIYFLQRQYKEISLEILSNTALVNKAKDVEDKLQVLYQGKTVNNIHIITIRLTNSGNIPITKSDYERPISIVFSPRINILEADVIKTEPDNIKAEICILNNKAIINPILLNKADSITFKIVLNEFDGFLKADARIYGVKDLIPIVKRQSKFNLINFLIGMLVGSFIVLLAFVLIMEFFGRINKINKNIPK